MLLPDGASKYLSKIFNDDWMRENGFLEEQDPLGTVRELLRAKTQRPADHRAQGDRRVARRHRAHAGQRHLADAGDGGGRSRLVGIVARGRSARPPGAGGGRRWTRPIDDLVEADYATVTPQTRSSCCRTSSTTPRWSCVVERDAIVGVITKIDLIEYLAERTAR